MALLLGPFACRSEPGLRDCGDTTTPTPAPAPLLQPSALAVTTPLQLPFYPVLPAGTVLWLGTCALTVYWAALCVRWAAGRRLRCAVRA
jgi:hypothetical protein